jgi:hypothetical protein
VDVLDGMRSLVESCQRRYGDFAGKSVLDIGCNDGSLLNFFRDKGAHTIGVEPTGAANDAITNGHQVIHDYLSPNLAREILLANGPLDFITFTNVFAHIEDLGSVLDSLEILLTEHTVLIIENHYLGAVLNGIQFDTFYHEHPRTYSLTSFQYIARRISTTIVDVDFPSRYGGNIRVFLKREQIVNEEFLIKANEIMERELTFNRLFSGVSGCFERWRSSKSEELLFLVSKHGSLRAKAFPGRAAILINTLKLDKNVISQVYEKPGSPKIGHYVPGTRISILSDNELFKLTDKSLPIVNLAWHIPLEIRSYLKQNDYCGPVIDIMSVEEVLTG